MSKQAMLPCIICGAVLDNAFDESINQPSEGTEFTSYGHYGSTFWDAFAGEEIVVNICDECLRGNTDRIGRHKRYRQLVVMDSRGKFKARTIVGRQWVDREMVPYFDGPEDEDDEIEIEPEEIGVLDRKGEGHYERIEWIRGWRETKANLMIQFRLEDGIKGGCKHERFVAECLDCGATPLQGLR